MVDPAIAVNLLWCVPGDVGGSEEYLVRQLLGLAEAEPRLRPTLYVVEGFVDAHRALTEQFPTVVATFDGASSPAKNRRRGNMVPQADIVGRSAPPRRWCRAHCGGSSLPADRPRPAIPHVPRILQSHRSAPYLAAMIGRSVRRARTVMVPSEYVRTSVIDAYAVDPSRVAVVPHGFEPDLLVDFTDEQELRKRFEFGDGPVIVYPAVTHPHKNHLFLIDLLATTWRDPDLRLVLIGGRGTAEDAVHAATDPRIRRLGRVTDADRNGLLRMAAAMVFPSRYEGFGAPLIEAMALGCPVVAVGLDLHPADCRRRRARAPTVDRCLGRCARSCDRAIERRSLPPGCGVPRRSPLGHQA